MTGASGYYGAAYKDDAGEIVIANRGTNLSTFSDFTNLKNVWSDIQLTFGFKTDVQYDAVKFAQQIEEKYGGPIIETGHSLGGNEAQAATVELTKAGVSVSAVTFDSPGIGGWTYDPSEIGRAHV